MKVLVIGGGGREHAIIHKLSKSNKIEKIYCAPGNPGISELAENVNILPMQFDLLINFAKEKNIDMTIAAMDDTLVAGIVDEFEKNGLKIFGPNKKAAIIEGSKAFSKNLMKKYNIPTANYETFSNYEDALNYIENLNPPIVIKADGLALGKGVLICKTLDEAKENLKDIMINKKFGQSGENVVIEEFMTGKEVSILCFCDGENIVPMVSAQDHKRAFDNDEGPNTGGMGTISPSKYYTEDIAKIAMDTIFKPTIQALAKEDRHFVGVLFFGLMLTDEGPKVIEYNARFGDPETQVVLPRLKTDLIDIMEACLNKTLNDINIEWEDYATSCVILASGGYPESYEKGYEIKGLNQVKDLKDVFIYHAGTTIKDNKIVNNGGRVLGIMAKGESLEKALEKSYNALNIVYFKDSFYRKDIGKR
nr:phosphoribosylamine--glycine ligase [uncultured Tyzzerella sp.]